MFFVYRVKSHRKLPQDASWAPSDIWGIFLLFFFWKQLQTPFPLDNWNYIFARVNGIIVGSNQLMRSYKQPGSRTVRNKHIWLAHFKFSITIGLDENLRRHACSRGIILSCMHCWFTPSQCFVCVCAVGLLETALSSEEWAWTPVSWWEGS